jgi:hypothetical protein
VEQKHKSSIFQSQNSNFTIKKWNDKYNLIQYIKDNFIFFLQEQIHNYTIIMNSNL